MYPMDAPAVAALPVLPHGQFLVVWEYDFSSGDSDIKGRLVSYDGIPAYDDIHIAVTASVDETQPSIAASAARGQYLVTWKAVLYQPFNWTTIDGRLVSPTGSLAGSPFNLGGLVANHPRVAAGWLGDFLTVFDDNPLFIPDIGIYGQLAGNRTYLPMIIR